MNTKILQNIKVIILAIIIVIGVGYVMAWTSPPANPPSNNVAAPINASTSPQSKAGPLSLGTTNPPTTGSILDVIGNIATQGLSVNGASIFNGQVQVRSGTPGLGKVLTAIDANGTMVWQNPPNSSPIKPIIVCKNAVIMSGIINTTHTIHFRDSDCTGNRLPDASYIGSLSRLSAPSGFQTVEILNNDGVNTPGVTFYGNAPNMAATYESYGNFGSRTADFAVLYTPINLTVSCRFTDTVIYLLPASGYTTYRSWDATVVAGGTGTNNYSWQIGNNTRRYPGTDLSPGTYDSGTDNFFKVSYNETGQKTASVTVTSGESTASAICTPVTVLNMP